MIRPMLRSWVKEPLHQPGKRIDSGEVWTVVQIAVMAGEGEVRFDGLPAVLTGDDVLDMKTKERVISLPHAAILAALVGAGSDLFSKSRAHRHA